MALSLRPAWGFGWLRQVLPFLRWWPLLDRATLRADLVAGITAGVLIVPQAIALATLAGLPPQYGLYTSIFPVIIACLWGSSWHALSGPNTALAVITAASLAPYANIGTPEYIQYAITLCFMVGVLSLLIGVLRLGQIFNYFSNTVMVALVCGVGITILVQQLGAFLGVQMNSGEDFIDTVWQVVIALQRCNPFAMAIGGVTVATGLIVRHYRRRWPHYIIAVVVGSLFAQALNLFWSASRMDIYFLGYLSFSALPFSAPDFSPQGFAEFSTAAYPAAISMTVLALMQAAVIARNTAAKSGQQGLDVNQEIIGQGLGNVVGSLFSCFVSCGSFNRSAANLEAGAKTPLAGVISALVVIALILTATPLLAYLPMPVVAGVLILVGAALVNLRDIHAIVRLCGEGRLAFVLVLATTLFSSVSSGVMVGILASIVMYLRSVSRPEMFAVPEDSQSLWLPADMSEAQVVRLRGNLYFGATSHLEKLLADTVSTQHLVIVGDTITVLDPSAAQVLALEAKRRWKFNTRLVLWLRPDLLSNGQVQVMLEVALGDDLRLVSQ
jgi:Sulfate permease and related transporters (MFS superfamily)